MNHSRGKQLRLLLPGSRAQNTRLSEDTARDLADKSPQPSCGARLSLSTSQRGNDFLRKINVEMLALGKSQEQHSIPRRKECPPTWAHLHPHVSTRWCSPACLHRHTRSLTRLLPTTLRLTPGTLGRWQEPSRSHRARREAEWKNPECRRELGREPESHRLPGAPPGRRPRKGRLGKSISEETGTFRLRSLSLIQCTQGCPQETDPSPISLHPCSWISSFPGWWLEGSDCHPAFLLGKCSELNSHS